MKKLIVLSALLLSACSVLSTPTDKYYAATQAVTAVGQATETFIDTCKTLPVTNSCYSKLPAIHTAAVTVQKSVKELDKVFVSGDSQYYDLSLSVTENAIKDLKKAME